MNTAHSPGVSRRLAARTHAPTQCAGRAQALGSPARPALWRQQAGARGPQWVDGLCVQTGGGVRRPGSGGRGELGERV